MPQEIVCQPAMKNAAPAGTEEIALQIAIGTARPAGTEKTSPLTALGTATLGIATLAGPGETTHQTAMRTATPAETDLQTAIGTVEERQHPEKYRN